MFHITPKGVVPKASKYTRENASALAIALTDVASDRCLVVQVHSSDRWVQSCSLHVVCTLDVCNLGRTRDRCALQACLGSGPGVFHRLVCNLVCFMLL